MAEHRAEVERAAREADWLRHAVEELRTLAPEAGEETALAERRTVMMQAEKAGDDLRDAHQAVAGNASPVQALASGHEIRCHIPAGALAESQRDPAA